MKALRKSLRTHSSMLSRFEKKTYEEILGVFTLLSEADKVVLEYLARLGISNAEALANRRVWANGTSEIRLGFEWIRVLPKDFPAPTEKTLSEMVYLALDRSRDSLFVIGVYRSKGVAWDACEKYWTQLSYCIAIENKEQWFDSWGMLHTKGSICGTPHHWFVTPFPVDVIVEVEGNDVPTLA